METGDIATYASLLLAFVALILAILSSIQLARVDRVAGQIKASAGELDASIEDMHNDLGAINTEIGIKLDEIGDSLTEMQTLVDQERGSEPEEKEGGGPTSWADADPTEYERMEAISLNDLPAEISSAIVSIAGAQPSWALRRRGRGRPRWLIGAEDGRSWRTTLTQSGPKLEPLPKLEYPVEPVAIADLGEEAIEAIVEATKLPQSQIGEVAYKRRSRGVPVFQFFAPTGIDGNSEAWRLVKTRWGWSAVRESA